VGGQAPLPRPRPAFAHGAVARLGTADAPGPERLVLVGCFHPSRQNTHTGRVTPAMYDALFARASELAGDATGRGPW
jgi:uracil-DNA glycosylase